MSFTKSTQYKHWFFDSPEKLWEIRNEVNREARERIKEIKPTPSPSGGKKKLKPLKDNKLLNAYEEYQIVVKNTNILTQLLERAFSSPTHVEPLERAYSFPIHVEATAMLFFKRFFLAHSVMEYDITRIMVTCIFLSCKVEDYYVPLETILNRINKVSGAKFTPEEILKLELTVLEGLRFHLLVYHPFRSLYAFVHDNELKSSLKTTPVEDLYETGKQAIKKSLLTDAAFLYPPGLIALAVLYECVSADQPAFLGYIQKKFAHTQQFMDSLKNITNMIRDAEAKSKESASSIEKKLKKVLSVVVAHQTETELEKKSKFEQKEAERRNKKAEERIAQEQEETRNLLS
jgi:cyclin H